MPMTRINCIPPQELSRAHLVAEYRELPRIFALVRAAIARGEQPTDPRNPDAYTLGRGHVRFFYPRLGYLVRRQQAILTEMIARGYNPTYRSVEHFLEGIPAEWCADWTPTEEAIAINLARIAERTAPHPPQSADASLISG
jgi:deoxyribonuclease (pyrimidine dimer)